MFMGVRRRRFILGQSRNRALFQPIEPPPSWAAPRPGAGAGAENKSAANVVIGGAGGADAADAVIGRWRRRRRLSRRPRCRDPRRRRADRR